MRKVDYFIKNYLEERPMFLSVIRTPEALLFDRYSKKIKEPILDFGCGDGFFSETVFGKNMINVGLDIKNERTEKIINANIYKKITFYDSKKIPYPSNYFQTVISNCVLEHIPDIDKSLKEIYRVLKPSGMFITTVMTNKWNDNLLGKKLFGKSYVNYMKKKQEHYNLLSLKEWTKLFKGSNFKIIKTIGYLNKKNSYVMDFAHYLSIPSLLSYKLLKNWQIFPKLTVSLWKKIIAKDVDLKVPSNQSSALFFCLYKKTKL